MAAEREAGGGVVGAHVVLDRGKWQGHGVLGGGADRIEQRQLRLDARHRPARLVAMADEAAQCTRVGKQAACAGIELRTEA